MSWISVKEKSPKNNQVVFVHTPSEISVCIFVKTELEYYFQLIGTNHEINNVTHWMPLPEPPKE